LFLVLIAVPKKKPSSLRRKAIHILVMIIHVNLSSILAAYNDNDNHDQRNSPIELRHYVIEFIIVFIYPHRRFSLFFTVTTNVLVKARKTNTA